MPQWNQSVLKSLLLPGGALLLATILLLASPSIALSAPAITFGLYIIIFAGLFLAWRFHSSRVFFALLTLLLANTAIVQFSSGHLLTPAARIALASAAALVPLNFLVLALIRERGFTSDGLMPLAISLFVECVVVTVLCRGAGNRPLPRHHAIIPAPPLPGYLWGMFAIAFVILLVRFCFLRKPVEIGLLWSLAAFLLALRSAGHGAIALAYFASAALILGLSIVETSYLLAYHDELTTLPSRRAFNDAISHIALPYSIAVVDIDHFKKFNDTYGHDTGDEVLRLVASKLARVTGGGKAFRCGGEEFNVLFPGKTTGDIVDHLEQLRATVESASFRLRGNDRRQMPRGPDRRQRTRRVPKGHAIRELLREEAQPQSLSVTVSIGVASSGSDSARPEHVIQAADKALYRAKTAGRNRVEVAGPATRRKRAKAAGIA